MSAPTTPKPTAQPALLELLTLAAKTRPDIDRDDLQGAIVGARAAGWSWPRVMVETVRMLARGEEPRDLRNAAATPWLRGTARAGAPQRGDQ